MKLKHLKLVGYRNYEKLSLDLSDGTNIFIGRNAQGKTNILESVCYASMGSSFRTGTDNLCGTLKHCFPGSGRAFLFRGLLSCTGYCTFRHEPG